MFTKSNTRGGKIDGVVVSPANPPEAGKVGVVLMCNDWAKWGR